MSNEPPNDNPSQAPAAAPRLPRDVDPHLEAERLQSISAARATMYEATGAVAQRLGDDVAAFDAARRAGLVPEAHEEAEPLESRLDLTRMVRRGASTEELRQALLDHAMTRFECDKAAILEPDESGKVLIVAGARTAGQALRDDFSLRIDEGVGGRVFVTGEREVVPDTSRCDFFTSNPDSSAPPKYLVAVPLESGGERVGVLCVERPVDQPATIAEIDALHAFAAHAAEQLRGVLVFEDLQRRVEQLSVMCRISRELSGSLERDKLLALIVSSARGLLNCGMCSLMLFDDDKQFLRITHAEGLPHDVVGSVRVRPGDGVSGWVAEYGEALLVEDIENDARFKRRDERVRQRRKYTTRSLLSVPLLIGTEVVGVLNVNNKASNAVFTERDRDNLTLLASQAAVSVENARLYETLQRLAVTDPLTKLFRRNYFEEQMDAELGRSRRYRRHLSVLMLDIDHFKKVNDNHGHQAGDVVLQALAGLLRRYGRKDDVIARFGGEEFCALLVETDIEGARLAGERIREAAAAFAFDVGRAEPLRITVSVGFASFPDHGRDGNELVKRADLALYAAKHGGRNQVRGYEPGLEMPAGGEA